jgi:DNA recombination protein RmuC
MEMNQIITVLIALGSLSALLVVWNSNKNAQKKIAVLEALENEKVNLEDENYPFNKTLEALNTQIKTIEDGYLEYLTTKEGINTKLDDLKSLTSKLNLTLSSNQKRGAWGEIQAEKILEDGGLVKGQHFTTQEILPGGGRPDITFKLPNEKILNLDVKFPLQNYLTYLGVTEKINNTIDENELTILEDKAKELKNQFLSDVRKRVDEVTKEGYISPSSNTIDYALMFVPVEGVFQFIVENELQMTSKTVDIYEYAIQRKVVIVPPSLLLVYLSTIKNAVDTFNLQDKAKNLIDVHKKFIGEWTKFNISIGQVGMSIETLQKKYNDVIGTRANALNRVVEEMDKLKVDEDF